MNRKPVSAGYLALLILLLASQGLQASGREVSVTLTQVTRQVISEQLYATAGLEAGQSQQLRSQASGRITRITHQSGDFIEAGALLIQLDDRLARANHEEARVQLQEDQRLLQRYQRLHASQSLSQDQLDSQIAAVAIAKARFQAAATQLEDYQIRAPFSGFLGQFDWTSGMLIDAGQELTTLDDLSSMQVDFALAEKHLAQVAPGQTITARVPAWPEEEFAGQVISVATRLDPQTRQLAVRARINNPEQRLRPGMLANLTLATQPRQALMIPARSLTYSADEKAVYLRDDEGLARRQTVETGLIRSEQLEITAGLEAGQWIVDQGVVKVREGVRLVPQETEEAAQ
ncbi:efflux RND transporter periplasmic adaptor subunit [Marinospirillum perlucidum]|uniref:efflux RND transporter periplasmic adaptor subunit n=1 Tax=Marinospirillum perlucidum TaxID=1982602 RepID=UPI0013905F7A|nr:efflux RND transporter periplasmic adaptor subunit [Marinospirillum perlucidum]